MYSKLITESTLVVRVFGVHLERVRSDYSLIDFVVYLECGEIKRQSLLEVGSELINVH